MLEIARVLDEQGRRPEAVRVLEAALQRAQVADDAALAGSLERELADLRAPQ
jgi:hypothetical protein